MVEEDRKKQWKCGSWGCGGGFRAERKIKKGRWSEKTELWRRRRGTRVSLKFGLLLERASLSSNSSICTICSPRIREPKLEKIVGQWKQQNWILTQRFHVKGELALITLTAWTNNYTVILYTGAQAPVYTCNYLFLSLFVVVACILQCWNWCRSPH